MKKCDKCGYENRDAAKFCNDCGAPLAKKSASITPAVCPSCGAVATQGAKFCGACGAELAPDKPLACTKCGYVNDADTKFCIKCGNALSAATAAESDAAAFVEPPASEPVHSETVDAPKSDNRPIDKVKCKVACAKEKTLAFEKKHNILINALIAALAIVVLFVSLFAPIKMRININDLSRFGNAITSNTFESDNGIEYFEVEQRFWKVFAALGYANLDISDDDDYKKIENIVAEYEDCMDSVNREIKEWRSEHPYASNTRIQEEYADILGDHLSDENLLAFVLAITSDGIIESESEEELDEDAVKFLKSVFIAARSSAVVALDLALVIVALCLTMAVVALIFISLAIYGIVLKRTRVNIFKFLTAVLALSGVGLIVAMAAPIIETGGVALALTVFSCVSYFVSALIDAVLNKKSYLQIIKRAAVCAAVIVAFFVLCGAIIKITSVTRAGTTKTELCGNGSIGVILNEFISALALIDYAPYAVTRMLGTSVASLIIALVLGIVLPSILLIAMIVSLKDMRACPNSSHVSVMLLAAAVTALLFAILPSAIGAAGKLPTVTNENSLWIKISVLARAHVYVSLVFAAIGAIMAMIFKSKKKQTESVSVE